MPASHTHQRHTWNSFQSEHKGRWSKEELSRQWKLYKQGLPTEQADCTESRRTAGAAAASVNSSRASHLAALKAGIKALAVSTNIDSTKSTRTVAPDARVQHALADQRVQSVNTDHRECAGSGASRSSEQTRDSAALEVSVQQTASTSSRHPDSCEPSHLLCKAGPAAADRLALLSEQPVEHVMPSTWQQRCSNGGIEQEQQGYADSQLEPPDTPSVTDTSPSGTGGSGSTLTGVPAHELAKLREAVHHLLANQVPHKPATQPPPQQQQQQPLDSPSAPCNGVSTGCFGRSWGHSRLSWNTFQKSCKGRGLSKTEISAAYTAAKQHYQQTGQLFDLDIYLQLQQQHSDGCQQQPVQAPCSQVQQRTTGRWGTLQHWLHSRTTSRCNSRACSRAASPSGSPVGMQQQPGLQGQGLGPRQGQQPAGAARGKWDVLKDWLHSRSSSRAVSRLGTPAASPGDRRCSSSRGQQADHAVAENQQHNQEVRQQQQQWRWSSIDQLGPDNSERDTHMLPFPQLPQAPVGPLCEPGCSVQQLSQQQELPPSRGAAAHCHKSLAASGPAADNSRQVCNRTDTASEASGSSRRKQQEAWRLQAPNRAVGAVAACSLSTSATDKDAAAAAQGTGAVKVHGRLARETVPDDLPGLLEGFSQWVQVHPQQLSKLKRAVPTRPGLYEWGVQLPTATQQASSGTSTACQAGGTTGPVLAFYLGKAGTLQHKRKSVLQQQQQGSTGETLRSRLNKYCFTKAARLGPKGEPHKAAIFAQKLQAGGRLYYRWRVLRDIEPVEAETQLLRRLDYAANFMHNHSRRALIVPSTA